MAKRDMNLQKLMSLARQAIDDYNMIEDGDRIAVGISGGKDSLTLLMVLNGLKRFYPKRFDIEAISVDLGFGNIDFSKIKTFCDNINVPYTVVGTGISDIVFNIKAEKSPCSLCAKLRKGAFNTKAIELKCNKSAFGHHRDDVINTMMLSLIYEGRFYSFAPVTELDRSGLTLIRPLIYINEADIKGYCNKNNIPVLKNPCPVDGETKRQYVKNLVAQINRDNPGVKDRMFTAILNGVDHYRKAD